MCDSSACAQQEGCCSAGHCVSGDHLDACGDKGDACQVCIEKCEGKRCCLQHRGGPCTLERCCSGLVCKGQGHPDPACCHPDEAFCADGGCCNKDCCGGTCCKDEEDCVNGACKRKCLSSQISCGDSSCCTPPDQCISGKCVGPCGSTAVRCGTANPPRCCHSGTVCCESEQVCYTPGATNCPHTVGRHIITVCPAVANTGLCCYKSTSDVVDCGFETVCPDSYIAKPLFECPD